MRLIDADALEKEVNTHTKSITPIENDRDMFYHDTGWNGATTAARVAIHHATTIDAVEVVRCKDCRFWGLNSTILGTAIMRGYILITQHTVSAATEKPYAAHE